ncbi:hypothetical protein MRX96_019756 [Rhipicephalus microplus]
MDSSSRFVLHFACAVLFFSTPLHGRNISDVAHEAKASERRDIVTPINLALRMSATLGVLWLLLLRFVPQLAVFSPWFFNGMALSVARTSSDAMLDTVQRWARSMQSCSASERLQCLQSLD